MGKFAEADARLFKNVFICKKCKSKNRSTMMTLLKGELRCRKCGYSRLKVRRKK